MSAIPNLDKVRTIFQGHSHDLGNNHLTKWLAFDKEIRNPGFQGQVAGLFVGRKEQEWFDELKTDYRRLVGKLKKRPLLPVCHWQVFERRGLSEDPITKVDWVILHYIVKVIRSPISG